MKSAVTVSLVPEARGGPFVLWDDLPAACRTAKELGFDAVEIFPSHGYHCGDMDIVRESLDDNGLSLAAVGTGAGWVKHKLTLTNPDLAHRRKAQEFVRSVIDFAGPFDAPVIIGSMQGRWGDGIDRDTARNYLADALATLSEHSSQYGVPLIYEPLNRYETNLVNRLDEGVTLLEHVGRPNVKLLADLFHMNIEEANLPAAIRAAGPHIGHVHLADSNRRPAGDGHTLFPPVVVALRDIGYAGYVSAECLPHPDPESAARATMFAFRQFFT